MSSNGGGSDVCDRLYEIAGVRPSRNWINNYRASQSPSLGGQLQDADSADAILQQILDADLRDVVREDSEVAVSQPNNNARRWRQLVNSMSPGSNDLRASSMRDTLPESFRLMIQLEELVDVSQNSEARLSGGGGGAQRCLKICISDGYKYAIDDNRGEQALFAMEVSPIPQLSLTSRAGLKMLLHGPIDIRWGILLLNEGNALVLGGSVQRMAALQEQALSAAKREAGVGIDPTIRALVWNPLTGDEQDEDEGEQESGDVRAEHHTPPPPPPPPPPPMGPQAPAIPILNSQQQQQSLPQNLQQQHQQPQQPSRRQPLMVSPTQTTTNATITRPGQRNPPTTLPRQEHHRHHQPTSFHATRASLGQSSGTAIRQPATTGPSGASINPYARTATATTRVATSASSSNNNDGSTTKSITSQTTTSSSARSTARSSTTDIQLQPSMPAASTSQQSTTKTTPQKRTAVALDNTRRRDLQDVTMTDTSSAAATIATTATTAHDSIDNNMGTTNQQNLSFRELQDLLRRAREDRAVYNEQFGKVFVVSAMKQIETHHYFQIEKSKKKKTKDKKYFYGIHAKFSGTSSDDSKISCAISSDIIEPYFGLSASALRNTSRSDKIRAQKLTSEGGGRLKEACTKLAQWQVTLNLTPDEFFRSIPSLGGKTPVLMLLDRKE